MTSRIEAIRVRILAKSHVEAAPKDCVHLGPCRIWNGPTSGPQKAKNAARGHSYPRMSLDGQTVAVHRVVWVNEHGYLPSRAQLDHLCKRRQCVALRHLEKVTHKVNQRRRRKGDKWTPEELEILKGHPVLHINRLPPMGSK